MILSDGKNRFKIKQGTSWWENGLPGWVVGFSRFWFVTDLFYVISNSCGDARSAEGAYDPGGGGGNKFETLGYNRRVKHELKYNQQLILYLVRLFYF